LSKAYLTKVLETEYAAATSIALCWSQGAYMVLGHILQSSCLSSSFEGEMLKSRLPCYITLVAISVSNIFQHTACQCGDVVFGGNSRARLDSLEESTAGNTGILAWYSDIIDDFMSHD
jgi:hypothetical protein